MTYRLRDFDGCEIPSATTTQVHDCGEPDHLHLIGFDNDDEPLCELVISLEIAERIAAAFAGKRKSLS